MKHLFLLKLYAGLLITSLLGSVACERNAATQRSAEENKSPNILFIVADDAGWKDFGCYGHPTIKTPHIDKLAETGLRFNNAFLTTSSCSPSRTSILAGKYAHSIGTEDMHVPLPDSVTILPTYFKKKGYVTGNMLKTHYGSNGEKQFAWYGNALPEFEDFLDSAASSPFFMWVGFIDPHRPYNLKEHKTPFDPAKVVVPPYMADTPETRQDLANYYSEIIRLDEKIGWMIAQLEKRNLRENTLIIFLSDNGAPFPRAKGTVYDSGIGTPLIFNWKARIPQGKVFEELVSTIDLAPTVLEIADISIPPDMQGKSLLPVIENREGFSRSFVFSERNWHGADEHIRSARDLQYKYITNEFIDLPFGTPSDIVESDSWTALREALKNDGLNAIQKNLFQYPRPRRELYDVRRDPDETVNLADDSRYTSVVEKMDAALREWQQSTGDVTPDAHPKSDKTDRFTGKKVIAGN